MIKAKFIYTVIDAPFFILNSDSRIKCLETGADAYAFRDGLENMKGRGQVIVVLKMWRVWKFLSKCSLCV